MSRIKNCHLENITFQDGNWPNKNGKRLINVTPLSRMFKTVIFQQNEKKNIAEIPCVLLSATLYRQKAMLFFQTKKSRIKLLCRGRPQNLHLGALLSI